MNREQTLDRRLGFTLVELLIAVAVSIVLVTAATLVLSVGMRTFASTAGSGESELREVQLVSALTRDITSALPLNDGAFIGKSASMTFPRLVSPTRRSGDATIALVSWTHDARRGWVRTLTLPEGNISHETFGRMRNVRLSYAGDSDEPSSSGSSEVDWRDAWAEPSFPGVVRIEADAFALEVALACSAYTLAEEEAKE